MDNQRYFLIFFTYAGKRGKEQHQGAVTTDVICADDLFVKASFVIPLTVKLMEDRGFTDVNTALTNILEMSETDMQTWKS